jgi:chaperonin GroES
MATPKIRPLSNKLVVSAVENESTTAGGIVIPDTADKDKPMRGKVVAIGGGKYVDGKLQPLQVKVGDEILFGKYAGTNFKFESKDYLVMSEEDVMGVIE